MIRQLGLDIGSSYTRIYDSAAPEGKKTALCIPTVISRDRTGKTIAVGDDAAAMEGKTPKDIRVCRPIEGGGITEPENLVRLLNYCFMRLEAISFIKRPDVVLSMQSGISEVEKKAIEEAVTDAGARKVATIDSSISGALGAGVRMSKPGGHLIVDFGGGCTTASVISMGSVVASETIRYGGRNFSRSIVDYVRNTSGIVLGLQIAEALKLRAGTVYPGNFRCRASVSGKDLRGGLIGKTIVGSEECEAAMRDGANGIIAMIKRVFDSVPGETSGDICDEGIIMIGGGALLNGMPELIYKTIGVRAMVVKNPSACVGLGTGKCIEVPTAEKYLTKKQ